MLPLDQYVIPAKAQSPKQKPTLFGLDTWISGKWGARLGGMIVVFCLLLSLIGSMGVCMAQSNNYTFNFEHLTIDEGLSHSTIYAIIQDQHGFIWLGTRYGLNRFDGYEFKLFLPQLEDKNSIGGNAVFSLLEDGRGDIWIGHKERGISIYTPKTGQFRRFPADKFPSIDWETISVRSLFEDKRGNIWIGTYGAGALVLDATLEPIIHLCSYCEEDAKKLSNDFVFDFEEDLEGNVWIGTAGEGISVFDFSKGSLKHFAGRPSDKIEGFGRELCLDPKGDLWIGTAGYGVYRMRLPEARFDTVFNSKNGLSHDMITDMKTGPDGDLWVATDGGGLNQYSWETGAWEWYRYAANHPGALNTDALYDLMFDSHDNLWVGSFNGGLNLHRSGLIPFDANREYIQERLLGLRSVLSLASSKDGDVWMGTDGAGLFHWQSDRPNILAEPLVLDEDTMAIKVITSIAPTPDGKLWLGTYGEGLYLIVPRRGIQQHYTYKPDQLGSISHNNVWDLALTDEGLWVGTLGGGLNFLPKGASQFKQLEEMLADGAQGLSEVQILDMLLDRKQEALWIATESGGLNRLDLKNLSIRQYHHDPDDNTTLSSERLRCLYEDEDGKIWIGTEYAGLNRLDPHSAKVERFAQREGLPSDMVNDIRRDSLGYLWVSTQAGICRWDQPSQTFLNVGSDRYLSNNQFNPHSSLRLADGRLVFGSTSGYVIILPDQVKEDTLLPSVLLSDLYLSNQLVPIGDFGGRTILNKPLDDPQAVVNLSYEDRGIQFLLTSSHAANASQQGYEYRLKNYQDDWQRLKQGDRKINISGLPGGDYILEVRVLGTEGRTGPVRRIGMKVKPPFWRTAWFIMLMILLVLLIVGVLIGYLLQRQKTTFRVRSMQTQQEILKLRNDNLKKDMENQHSRLSASVLQVAHKNELLNSLKSKLIGLKDDKMNAAGLKRVVREIDRELKQEDYWQQFQLVFDRTHTQFIDELQKLHPRLTNHEKRLCCFIRMQLSNPEIASILNITINGVEQAKYRIKKKLALTKETSLNDYIRNI